ncbi:nodulin-related protein 1-like [Zingiber officinale]|uniref:Nodulin-related protein 1 n=1 Tax=Zingiber officinale TaxID=94328 RepID=A0A8J5I7L1_ZINOF|nr:nodulin-related protein 1-like [Zingiber officinale]KAG6537388.1 hypothetical protein ZIOFF_002478 [Zingiber officinale]
MDPHDHTTSKPDKPNTSQLVSSAKVMSEAAKSALHRRDIEEIDKAKVAGAAADLLGAASQYAKLEEKGLGKYVGQAQDYLHKYQPASDDGRGSTNQEEEQSSSSQAQNRSKGGFGKYLKLAQGFLKKL